MPRIVTIIIGTAGIAMGIFMATAQTMALFTTATSSYYVFSYSNTLSGVAQEAIILITNIWLAMGGILGGSLLLVPVKLGRFMRVAGYTTPDSEIVRKAYRAGGLYMLIGGIAASVTHIFMVRVEIVLIPLLSIILGLTGLLAGYIKER